MSTDGHQSTKKLIDALISPMQIHAETLGLRGAFQIHKRKFPVERFTAKWHEDPARTFVLEAQDESFNECDTHVLANSTEAGCDLVVITPILEHAAPELLALVGDVYLGVVLAVLMAHSRKRETDTAVGLCLKVSMPITRRE